MNETAKALYDALVATTMEFVENQKPSIATGDLLVAAHMLYAGVAGFHAQILDFHLSEEVGKDAK